LPDSSAHRAKAAIAFGQCADGDGLISPFAFLHPAHPQTFGRRRRASQPVRDFGLSKHDLMSGRLDRGQGGISSVAACAATMRACGAARQRAFKH